MRVDLRRGQVRMPQHHLHRAQIGAVIQQMGGKRVSQRVRRDAGGYTCDRRVTLDGVPKGLPGHSPLAIARKQR